MIKKLFAIWVVCAFFGFLLNAIIWFYISGDMWLLMLAFMTPVTVTCVVIAVVHHVRTGEW